MSKPVVITNDLWWSTSHQLPEIISEGGGNIYRKRVVFKLFDGTQFVGQHITVGKKVRWESGHFYYRPETVTHWKEIK